MKLFAVESVILEEGLLTRNRSCVTVFSNQRIETRRVRMRGTWSIKIFYEILLFLPQYTYNFSIFQISLTSAKHYDLLWELPSSSFWMDIEWTDQYVTFILSHMNSKAGTSQDPESTLASHIFCRRKQTFELFTVVSVKFTACWDVTLCNLLGQYTHSSKFVNSLYQYTVTPLEDSIFELDHYIFL